MCVKTRTEADYPRTEPRVTEHTRSGPGVRASARCRSLALRASAARGFLRTPRRPVVESAASAPAVGAPRQGPVRNPAA